MITIAVMYFLILATMLTWILIGVRGHWWIKSLLIPPVVGFSIIIGTSLTGLLGWPSDEDMPDKYQVHWAIVYPPSLQSGNAGEILLWVSDIGKAKEPGKFAMYKPKRGEPRVHRVPYSKPGHDAINKALGMIRKGKKVFGKGGSKPFRDAAKGEGEPGFGEGKGKGKGKKGGGKTGGSESKDDAGPKFYELLPAKPEGKNRT